MNVTKFIWFFFAPIFSTLLKLNLQLCMYACACKRIFSHYLSCHLSGSFGTFPIQIIFFIPKLHIPFFLNKYWFCTTETMFIPINLMLNGEKMADCRKENLKKTLSTWLWELWSRFAVVVIVILLTEEINKILECMYACVYLDIYAPLFSQMKTQTSLQQHFPLSHLSSSQSLSEVGESD